MIARAVAWLLGLAAVALLVVLGVAGLAAAWGILVTGVGIVAMIAMGNLMGGRHTANRAPGRYVPDEALPGAAETVLRRQQAASPDDPDDPDDPAGPADVAGQHDVADRAGPHDVADRAGPHDVADRAGQQGRSTGTADGGGTMAG